MFTLLITKRIKRFLMTACVIQFICNLAKDYCLFTDSYKWIWDLFSVMVVGILIINIEKLIYKNSSIKIKCYNHQWYDVIVLHDKDKILQESVTCPGCNSPLRPELYSFDPSVYSSTLYYKHLVHGLDKQCYLEQEVISIENSECYLEGYLGNYVPFHVSLYACLKEETVYFIKNLIKK